MNVNINEALFRKYAPKKKLEIIEKLTSQEISLVKSSTIERIVKEVGEKFAHSRSKKLHISRNLQKGNNWNSTIEGVYLIKGKLYLDVYLQYDSTDTNTDCPMSPFFARGEYRGGYDTTDRYNNPRTYYFVYYEDDKLNVLRSILLQYVYSKYPNSL